MHNIKISLVVEAIIIIGSGKYIYILNNTKITQALFLPQKLKFIFT